MVDRENIKGEIQKLQRILSDSVGEREATILIFVQGYIINQILSQIQII